MQDTVVSFDELWLSSDLGRALQSGKKLVRLCQKIQNKGDDRVFIETQRLKIQRLLDAISQVLVTGKSEPGSVNQEEYAHLKALIARALQLYSQARPANS